MAYHRLPNSLCIQAGPRRVALGRAFRVGLVALLMTMSGAWPGATAEDANAKKTAANPFSRDAIDFFESRVRPILVDHCIKCHGPKKQSSSLRLDSREAALKGGDSGPALVPAKPEESLLVQAVAQTHEELKMPPGGKLPEASVAVIRQWVALGAPWSAATSRGVATAQTGGHEPSVTHWSFRPLVPPSLPPVKDRNWAEAPVDAFILARLEAAEMTPSAPADKRTLIRRASIDLRGIPPTAEEIAAFELDASPDAFARVVDRLLASPHYGERWGRHWLDVARYADTKGYVFTQDRHYPYAYTYRDYVIRALNTDLPFDQFVLEQLAADQLPRGDDPRPMAAMGFLTVGRRFLLDQNEIIDDRIDVVSRGLLGLTVTCARCHDHKFDPIPTEDYYSLYGVFASSIEPAELPQLQKVEDGPSLADYERKLNAAKKARDDFLAAQRDEFLGDLTARFSVYLKAAYDLDLDGRSRRLDERARVDKLNARRLRGLIGLWKRAMETTPTTADRVLGPWRSFAALPQSEFAPRAKNLHRDLTKPKDPKAAPIHPLVVRAVLGGPPTSQSDVVARYVALFGELETRLKDQKTRSSGAASASLADPEWESLRQALFGRNGPLALSAEQARMFLDQGQRGRLDRLNGAIEKVNGTHPAAPARAMVMIDAPALYNPHVFLRGNPGRPGPAVPRRFLRLLSKSDRKPFEHGSGRLDLARAIADARNPLTARVLVNRVWQWHFGKGLVTTPSDFGVRSDPPSHPELLDYLASEFIASGWSIKSLHRRIMLSSTYQQRSDPRPAELERDPENRLLWRFNRQRLDFEAMRDSLLAAAGDLDATIGGPATPITESPFSMRRTIYGFIDRQNLDGLYRTFDFAVPDATSARRFVTTVPQQALFLMNSPFLHEQARRLAAAVASDDQANSSASSSTGSPAEPADGVRRLYLRVLGRPPAADELALGIAFVQRQFSADAAETGEWKKLPSGNGKPRLSPWEQLAQVLLMTNEFMFVD
jgi:cytochrome c553